MNTRILLLSAAVTVTLAGCTSDMSRDSESRVAEREKAREAQTVSETSKTKQAIVQSRSVNDSQTPARTRAHREAKSGAAPALRSNVPSASGSQAFRPASPGALYHLPPPADRENYNAFRDGGIKRVAQDPVSTFSIDVDTGAYSNVRRFLNQGTLPPEDAVRIEELVNYFDYSYDRTGDGEHPFSVHTELAPTPWNEDTVLLKVGIHGDEIEQGRNEAANLVFLVDVSGSMRHPNKLALVKKSLLMLVRHLEAKDSVAIVVYAGSSGVVLEPVAGDSQAKIRSAIESLRAGGGTNGADGIRTAYHLAREHFVSDGVNRVLLATDGDFNVGTIDFDELKRLVERERKSGVYLTTLGFGQGNYNDHLMEQLADTGNGNYAYIDTVHEARKVLVDEMGSTLYTIAKDVKIQVEFNPALVDEYRLVGYENRVLAREDFNDDRVDAGEIGAGHTVTALYEVALKGRGSRRIDPLRYQKETEEATPDLVRSNARDNELAFVKLRYKKPKASVSTLIEHPIANRIEDKASIDMRFASAVAGFGQLLRGGRYVSDVSGDFGFDRVLEIARGARGVDHYGYRAEFIKLVQTAEALDAIRMSETPGATHKPTSGMRDQIGQAVRIKRNRG